MRELDTATWIAGLMRENYDAVGFIPQTTLEHRYLISGRYVLQSDERGRRVGYLLHGALHTGQTVSVAQHCIQVDSRLRGYGERALAVLIERAVRVGASGISVRVATELPALEFWQAQGFVLRSIVAGGAKRQRTVARLWLPLALPLFGVTP